MRITGIIWFHEIVQKLQIKHKVHKQEVRETLESRPSFQFIEKGHRTGEDVYAAFGRTSAGRYLVVFFVHKLDGQALVVSARDMTKTERRRYAKK